MSLQSLHRADIVGPILSKFIDWRSADRMVNGFITKKMEKLRYASFKPEIVFSRFL